MDYRQDCHSYHICIRPLKLKTDTDKMNISVRSLVNAIEGESSTEQNKSEATVGHLPDIVQCSSQVREMEEFPMDQCEMEEEEEEDEDGEDVHDESPVKLLKITRKTSCYYRKAPVALPRGYKAKNCSGILARSSSLSWEGTAGPQEDDLEPSPPTRSQSMIWSDRTSPKTSTSSLMKAIHDAMQQPKKSKKTKRKAPDKPDGMKVPRNGQAGHLMDVFKEKTNRIKVEPSDKFVCTERIEDIQAKIQRWARSMASDSDGDDDGEFDEINLELQLSSASSRSGTDVISISSSPTCSQTDTEVISIILADPSEEDDFDREFVSYSGRPTTHERTEKIIEEWTFTSNKKQPPTFNAPTTEQHDHLNNTFNNCDHRQTRTEQPLPKTIPSFYHLVTQKKEVKTDVQTESDLDFSHLKVTEKNLDFNVNKQKLSLSKRGGLAKRRKPTKFKKSKRSSEPSESEASEPSDAGTSGQESDAEDAHLQKVKAMGGVPTAIVTSGIKDLCVEKLRLLKVSPKDENKHAHEDPPWVKAAIAIKERAFAHTSTTDRKSHPSNQPFISSHTWSPKPKDTTTKPKIITVSSIQQDEVDNSNNTKNIQESKIFNLACLHNDKGKRNVAPKVADENKPPETHTTDADQGFPWKSVKPPTFKPPTRNVPHILSKFTHETGQKEAPLPSTTITQTPLETESAVQEFSPDASPEWIKGQEEKDQHSVEAKSEEQSETTSHVAPWLLELNNRKKSGRTVLKAVDPPAAPTRPTEDTVDLPEWVKQAQRRRERLAEYGLIEDLLVVEDETEESQHYF